ncbi:MAG: glycoside hydrolase family 31 protein [Treponema sp.]|jgi:alpha-D-xyloside xylohydrolase|nr:glycoside hydrolase family 31 protein [Treponema sp.]
MSFFTKTGGDLLCRLNGETMLLCPWGKNAIRVLSAAAAKPVFTDWALLPREAGEAEISLSETEARISTGKITGVVKKLDWPDRLEVSFYNRQDRLLFREREAGGALQLRARKFKPIPGGDYRLTFSLAPEEDEKLYGMGQYQQEILNVKNCSFELAHRNSQASVPFVLSSRGYGFLWHNPAIGRAVFGRNGTEWYAESTKQLDYWVCAGDTPAEICGAYADATGHVPMMPEYGLGFWQSRLRYWNQEQLLEAAREYRRRGLPIDVIVCDFFHWPKMGDFRFEEEFFPNPQAMTEELERMNIKLMVSVWPQIALESENFREMKARGLLVSTESGVQVQMQFGGDSVFFDPTNPEARDYVWQKCKKSYYDIGVRIFWLDEAEPEYGVYDFDNYRYFLGPNIQIGNIYPQLYARAFFDGMTGEGQKEVVNHIRCAWAGSQRYGALVWSGDVFCDFASLRRQVCIGLNMGIAGIPWWNSDIGGFHGGDPADPGFRELLVRWFQFGTFSPVMRLHGDRRPTNIPVYRKDGTVSLFTGSPNEVWSYGGKVYGILKKYLCLRESMRPYIRGLMKEAHERGAPVMRPMFYEFPEDPPSWDLKDQYMFGPDMLIAPVMEAGALKRPVYLPPGAEWRDLHSGETYEGGQTIAANAPLEVIPVFLRNGNPSLSACWPAG